MRKILTYEEYKLQEALSISTAKEIMTDWNPNNHKKLFNGAYRLYFPLYSKKGYTKKEIQNIEHQELQKTKIQEEIELFITEHGYVVDDYSLGYCSKKNDKRQFRIGKILNKEGSKELLDKYNLDLEKQKNTGKVDTADILIVISRHPYDIAGMSTDREWSSCMNLDNGKYNYKIQDDIKLGTMIAYLVKKEDTNINNPLGRILIKKFVNTQNKRYKGDVLYLADPKIYGEKAKINGFRETVEAWLESWQPNKNGTYVIHDDLYDDETDAYTIHQDGEYTEYWSDDDRLSRPRKIHYIATYKNNKRNGKFTSFYHSGALYMTSFYKDDLKDGLETEYYDNPDKQIHYKVEYKDGKVNGKWISYNRDGTLYNKATYKDGNMDGNDTHYNRNGTIDTIETYDDGIRTKLIDYNYDFEGKLKFKTVWDCKDGRIFNAIVYLPDGTELTRQEYSEIMKDV